MDNNNFTFNLQGILGHTMGLVKSMETGEGLGLKEEQREDYLKKMKESGGLDKVEEIKKQMENLKDIVNKSNGKSN